MTESGEGIGLPGKLPRGGTDAAIAGAGAGGSAATRALAQMT